MDGFRFDDFARLVGTRVSRRTSLAMLTAGGIGQRLASSAAGKKKKQKISVCYQGQTRKVKKKGWQKRYPGATKGACGAVCAGCPDACFATVRNSAEAPPPGYACCPADKLCPTQRTDGFFPDQCCYSDEVCAPDRVVPGSPNFDSTADSLCCRSCGGMCCAVGDHCVNGFCEGIGTARLPRTRRP
jgi:hypothetical protein